MTTPPASLRLGLGFDAHRFGDPGRLVLGGIEIPFERRLAGHSDGDALLHALADALLGALGLPDIGRRFPDTDPALKDADSRELLGDVLSEVADAGWVVANVDCVLVCDLPRLAPHADAIRASVADLLGIPAARVGLKAKTTEGTMLAVPGESVAALASVLLSGPVS